MRRIIPAALLTMVAAIPAMAAEGPFDGRWAWDPEICANERGTTDAVPTEFAGDQILHYESACTITSLTPIGTMEQAWDAAMTCGGEGETWERRVIFGLSGAEDGSLPELLVEIDRDDGMVIVRHRCE